jgi:hypothetical protein
MDMNLDLVQTDPFQEIGKGLSVCGCTRWRTLRNVQCCEGEDVVGNKISMPSSALMA